VQLLASSIVRSRPCILSVGLYFLVEQEVDAFLFGSRSKFNKLCHIVVMGLKEKYPYIQRIGYLCKNEIACLMGQV